MVLVEVGCNEPLFMSGQLANFVGVLLEGEMEYKEGDQHSPTLSRVCTGALVSNLGLFTNSFNTALSHSCR